MGVACMILGRSGSGKSTSLRNLKEVGVFNVLGKLLPFRNNGGVKEIVTDNYDKIKQVLLKSDLKTFVIDDSTYLMTNKFMANQNDSANKGNKIFEFYNQLAKDFWDLINFVNMELPKDKIVYFMMHEETSELGDVKPKTIGKMLDDKVCVEGMFTIVLRAMKRDGKHIFSTQSNGSDVAKSPFGMFDETMDNDLNVVNEKIKEYYNIGEEK